MAVEIAMLHDVSKCSACRGCSVACKQWKNLPADPTPFDGEYQSHKDLSSKTYTIIRMKERMVDNKIQWNFLKFQCMHCGVAGCVLGCPEKALEKLDNGIVAHHKDKCVGCKYCETNCTFGVPHVDPETKKSTKCNLCIDRVEKYIENDYDPKYMPSCAKTCTADAILFGTREEMVKIANDRVAVLKEKYPDACTYNVDTDNSIKGGAMMYVLTQKPSVYGLPDNPELAPSLSVWKDGVQPAGKVLIGAAAVAVAGAAIVNTFTGGGKNHGGSDHE
ncbi:MAG: hypothetical protein K2N67_06940 [Mucispirillum sp.]|nr:hypothetical protein [Mucispirillum sp.]